MLIKSSQVKLALPFITARGKQQPVIGTTLLQHYSECRRKAAETISYSCRYSPSPWEDKQESFLFLSHCPELRNTLLTQKSDSRKRETDCAVIETV